jgi:hypothetical protein
MKAQGTLLPRDVRRAEDVARQLAAHAEAHPAASGPATVTTTMPPRGRD